jgi:hypothetical protein
MKKISIQEYPDSPLYYKINPDLDASSKILSHDFIIGQNEKTFVFGELQVYNKLLIKGCLEVLIGNEYFNYLPPILNDFEAYGPILINDETIINGAVNIL